MGREKPENTKTACKFASMFAHRVFGGTLEGNAQHQYLRTSDGHVLDLTDWSDESAYSHDASFFHNPEHAESMGHCKARVDRWVAEFVEKMPLKESFEDGAGPSKNLWIDRHGKTYPIAPGSTHSDVADHLSELASGEGYDALLSAGWVRVHYDIGSEAIVHSGQPFTPAQMRVVKHYAEQREVDVYDYSHGRSVLLYSFHRPREYKSIFKEYGTASESLLHEGKVRIEHWSEEMDDPWEVADKAERAFRASGLRPMNSKELGYVAFDEHGNPIGATYHQVRQQPAEDFGGPEDDFVTVFEFDVGVDPKHQGGVVGWMLCKAAIQSANWDDADLIRNWVINPKMADMLERLFGFEHESEPQTREGYSSHMVKWLKHMDTSVTESIKCAAIRYEGQIYTGNSHFECYTNAAAAAGIDPEDQWAWVESRWDDIVSDDGFLTDDGRFLNREEAHEEAVASRQAARKPEGSLDSEDLYVKSHADALIRAHT